jgi:anti-repressor protein
MEKALQVFSFEGKETRIVEVEGEPRFVAKDVATALGYSESSTKGNDLFRNIPEEWKGVESVSTPGGIQEMLCLSEQGLYLFLGRSDKAAALPYQKKVAGEIMPSIRKYGAYMTPQKIEEILLNPDTIISLAEALKKEQTKSKELEAKLAEDYPKVLFADSVAASRTSILVGELAKILRQNGVEVGQNRLFQWLRDKGYLMKEGGSRNMPTQRAIEMGLFEIKERTIQNPDGSIRTTKTPLVTGRGQIYFINKLRTQAA